MYIKIALRELAHFVSGWALSNPPEQPVVRCNGQLAANPQWNRVDSFRPVALAVAIAAADGLHKFWVDASCIGEQYDYPIAGAGG